MMQCTQHFTTSDTVTTRARRILLVEDDCNIKMVYQFFLTKLGFDVCAVSTAREALLHTQKETYDMMVLDLGLPDASGETVITAIRARETDSASKLPIIVITAHGDEKIKCNCRQKGADDVFIKPISLDKFRHIVGQL